MLKFGIHHCEAGWSTVYGRIIPSQGCIKCWILKVALLSSQMCKRVCNFSLSHWVSTLLTSRVRTLMGKGCFPANTLIFPSSKGAQITFSGLWHNLVQSQVLLRVIILTADILYCTLLPFTASGLWYEPKSLEVLHCILKRSYRECHPSKESTYGIPVPQDRSVNTCELLL